MSKMSLGPVKKYYDEKLAKFGVSAAGVDWNSEESKDLRYEQILKVAGTEGGPFEILDYGCGYGGLLGYLKKKKIVTKYKGYDISEDMVASASHLFPEASFASSLGDQKSDFVVASGIFNVRLQATDQDWHDYVLETLGRFDQIAVKGFSFNCLSTYSDIPKRRDYLYYADPLALFDHCKRRYSKNVALLHDYGLYEFTILVRK